MDRGRTAFVLSEVMTKSQSAVEKTSAKSLSSQWRVRIRSMGLFSQPAAGGDPPGLLGGARRGAEREELGEALTKGLDVVLGLHVSRYGEGDSPGLLRDDEHDRVRFLGQAEGRAVTRAHVPRELRVAREGQEAARRGHASAADEDGAVVQRRVRQEEALEEVGGDERVQRH